MSKRINEYSELLNRLKKQQIRIQKENLTLQN